MFIKSNILRSPHAFSTRVGGVSALEHTRSLNLAFGRGDDDSVVLRNIEVFANEVGFDKNSIISLPQIHSDRIFKVTRADCGKGYYITDGIESGDGYVTNERGVTLGIKTADCVPILFEAQRGDEIIAAGAVHAGWRGTAAMIAPKCVKKLADEFGADIKSIRAVIGPCIQKCCYEVGKDLFDSVCEAVGLELAKRFVPESGRRDGKYFCDLSGLNKALLIESGVDERNIEIIDECTCHNPDKFFSHRYSNGSRGTMLSVIFIK